MTKTKFALTSLVAAGPAAFLAYLLVMAFLNDIQAMPMLLQVLVGITLAGCVVAALSPVGILVFAGGGGATKAKKPKKDKKKAADEADEEDDLEEEMVVEDDEMGLGGFEETEDGTEELNFDDEFDTAENDFDDEFELDFDDEK